MKGLKFTKRDRNLFFHKKNKFFKIFSVIVLLIGIYFVMFFCGHKNFTTCEPYLYSVMMLEQNTDALKYLGKDYSLSWYVGGEILDQKANIKYIVNGSQGQGRVIVEAQMVNNFWIYDKVQFEKIEIVDLEKKDKFIDLLK